MNESRDNPYPPSFVRRLTCVWLHPCMAASSRLVYLPVR